MYFSIKYIGIVILFCGLSTKFAISSGTKTYFAFERVHVLHNSKTSVPFLNVTSRRISRLDPNYYINIHMITLKPIDRHLHMDIYFLQLLTNQYKRSFVELHMRPCDLLDGTKMNILGFLSEALGGRKCPLPPGEYNMQNCTVSAGNSVLLKNFPFPKGRVHLNYTNTTTGEHLAEVISDFEIREMKEKKISKV